MRRAEVARPKDCRVEARQIQSFDRLEDLPRVVLGQMQIPRCHPQTHHNRAEAVGPEKLNCNTGPRLAMHEICT